MALTKCNVPKDVIGSLGTNPSERGLTTQQFKDKFDEMPEGIIDYLNNTLTEEIDSLNNTLTEEIDSLNNTLTEEIDSLAEKVATLANKNILHNWDFRNPVNQRGQSSYSGAEGYCIDRWYRYPAATVTVNSGYVTLNASDIISSYFCQRLERLPSGTYTLSVNIDGEIKHTTLTWDGATRVEATLASGAKSFILGLTVDYTFPTFYLLPKTAASYDVYAAKLELGSVSTLANDPPADYGEELRKCQRYFYRTGVSGFANAVVFDGSGSVYGMANVRFPVTMRIAPTVTFYSTAGTQGKIAKWETGLDFANVSVHSATGAGKDGFGVIQASTALIAGNAFTFHYAASAEL